MECFNSQMFDSRKYPDHPQGGLLVIQKARDPKWQKLILEGKYEPELEFP